MVFKNRELGRIPGLEGRRSNYNCQLTKNELAEPVATIRDKCIQGFGRET
jgi:hypothetical protein